MCYLYLEVVRVRIGKSRRLDRQFYLATHGQEEEKKKKMAIRK